MAKRTNKASMNISIWVVVAALVLGFGAGFFVARARYMDKIAVISTMNMQKADELTNLRKQLNKVVMMDGRMMVIKNGEMMRLTEEMTLSDGTKVMPNGRVIRSDGTIVMMQDGDGLGFDGSEMTAEEMMQ